MTTSLLTSVHTPTQIHTDNGISRYEARLLLEALHTAPEPFRRAVDPEAARILLRKLHMLAGHPVSALPTMGSLAPEFLGDAEATEPIGEDAAGSL